MSSPPPAIPRLPERISALPALASNISWSWSRRARALFRAIDYPLWALTRHNPIEVLRRVDPDSLVARAGDPEFLRLYDAAVAAPPAKRRERRPGSRSSSRASSPAPSRTSARSSACTTRCRSIPAGLASWPVTTARPRRIWACRSSASGCCIPRGTSTSGSAPTDGRRTRTNASIRRSRRSSACSARAASRGSSSCEPPDATCASGSGS